MYDDERRLSAVNDGMVAGFFLFCISSLVLIVCCCFIFPKRNAARLLDDEEAQRSGKALDLVETDSSGSESPKDDAAIELFLKGRQAAMAEGLRDEPMDAYAVGYLDGAHHADERKEPLTDAQVMKKAKKLGYAGASADEYVQGFQLGARNGVAAELPDRRDAYAAGLLNAEARGLSDRDREAYARGYAAGDESGVRFNDNDELTAKAESEGFTGPLSELYAAGYNDGVDGTNVTDVLSPSAAFQKGLANAAALGLSEDDAVAHASGFQDGYAFALVGDESEPISEADMTIKAAEAGFTGDAVKHYCAGFDEGVDEGTAARSRVFLKGLNRADALGMTGDFASAFATGYKDGCANSATGKNVPSDQVLKSNAKSQQFLDEDEVATYIRGFREGHKSTTTNGGPIKDILLPEAILDRAFLDSRERNNDKEASAAYASGCHDGYCFGLNGGTSKAEAELHEMADKLGFEGYNADVYAGGFKEGIIEGNEAREAVLQKGKGKASSIGLSGDAAVAYANGYRDGNTVVISGEEDNVLPESILMERANKLGYSKELSPFYVNGFQDGQRDGIEQLASGHSFSEGAYAKGLLDAKAEGMFGDVGHAYATGYSEGYERGLNGDEKVSEEDVHASAVEHAFDNKKTKKAFARGFSRGLDDGFDTRKKHVEKILSPTAALEKGAANASVLKLKGEAAKAYSDGFGDGYSIGLAGFPCPKDEDVMEKAGNLGFSADSRLSYLNGFKEGHTEGAMGAVNKNSAGLNPEAALTKGTDKADIHGMKGGTAKAYADGYKDGYTAGLEGAQRESSENAANLSHNEINEKAQALGFLDKTHIHAYIAGYLAGQGDGGAVVLHHTLCDVHRCTSSYCETCRKMASPKFLHIPQGYQHTTEKFADKLWWNNKNGEDSEIV